METRIPHETFTSHQQRHTHAHSMVLHGAVAMSKEEEREKGKEERERISCAFHSAADADAVRLQQCLWSFFFMCFSLVRLVSGHSPLVCLALSFVAIPIAPLALFTLRYKARVILLHFPVKRDETWNQHLSATAAASLPSLLTADVHRALASLSFCSEHVLSTFAFHAASFSLSLSLRHSPSPSTTSARCSLPFPAPLPLPCTRRRESQSAAESSGIPVTWT